MQIYSVKQAKKLIIVIVGFTILLIGVALLVLPGPGIVIIIAGLMVLAGQYLWAKRLMNKIKQEAGDAGKKIRRKFYSFLT